MEQELVGIQIQIAGKAYPLKVAASETTMIEEVANQVNDKINTLQKTYPRQDKDDYLSMAFFAYALDIQKNQTVPDPAPVPVVPTPVVAAVPTIENNNTFSDELTEKILQIDQLLDHLLDIKG
jgi:cell division protein ZapA (FtsZ GTPase activity inhibitor)